MSRTPRQEPRLEACVCDLSIERRARKDDVSANGEPEGVVADDRYLDEHAEDRDDNHKERSHKTKVHCAYLPVRPKRSKNLAFVITHGNARDHLTRQCARCCGKPNASWELSDLSLAMRVLSLGIVVLEWTLPFEPRGNSLRVAPKPDSRIFRGFNWRVSRPVSLLTRQKAARVS
jgi:hypothetical protein